MYAVMYTTANPPTTQRSTVGGKAARGTPIGACASHGGWTPTSSRTREDKGRGAHVGRNARKKDARPCKDGCPPLVLSIEGDRPRSFHDRKDDGYAQEHRQRPRHRSGRRTRDRRTSPPPPRSWPQPLRGASTLRRARCTASATRAAASVSTGATTSAAATDNRLSKLSRCRRQRGHATTATARAT